MKEVLMEDFKQITERSLPWEEIPVWLVLRRAFIWMKLSEHTGRQWQKISMIL